MLAQKLMGSAGGASDKLYVDDVFSTYLYTGNGSAQTINNGIDLAGKGGLVWTKYRNSMGNNALIDTVRGGDRVHYTNSPNGQGSAPAMTFTGTGYNTCPFNWGDMNGNGGHYVSHTFRRAPKFFDVVTYTGNGVAGRQIAHSLGQSVGMLVIKRTDAGGSDWAVWHRGAPTLGGRLNQTDVFETGYYTSWVNSTQPSDTVFTVSSDGSVNQNGATYVAYLFAHDPSTDGIIQCSSFTADASGNATVNLGWEPQYFLFKNVATGSWWIQDIARPFSHGGTSFLQAESAATETAAFAAERLFPTATGVQAANSALGFSATYIYLAIRRPNKPPTTGTEVYNAIARTGTGAAATITGVGFAPDLVKVGGRNLPSGNVWFDRLRGAKTYLSSQNTYQEITNSNSVLSYDMGGCTFGADTAGDVNLSGGYNYINHFFRRAPGFMDVVCYTGTGATHTESHNLGAVPEIIIVKGRSAATQWVVYSSALGATKYLSLNSTAAEDIFSGFWDNVTPTSSVFTVGTGVAVNQNSQTHVAYLFATKVGISKVGNYTGNGGTQTIACGFTTGARFVLIKRTASTGDWYVWSSATGIVAGNDPHLSLNTTAVEVTTDDSIDPDASGFIVNQVAATNINVNAASYIYLAIA